MFLNEECKKMLLISSTSLKTSSSQRGRNLDLANKSLKAQTIKYVYEYLFYKAEI